MATSSASDPSTRGDGLLARFSAEIWDPRCYINQQARAGSQLVQAGTYSDSLRPRPGLAMRAGTTRPGARAYNHYGGPHYTCRLERQEGTMGELLAVAERNSGAFPVRLNKLFTFASIMAIS